MRRITIAGALMTVLFLASCPLRTPTVPDRATLLSKTDAMRSYEEEREMFIAVLSSLQQYKLLPLLKPEARLAIRQSADLAYMYYIAAIVAFTNGKMEEGALYLSHARSEIDRANAILAAAIKELAL